jgi:predicted nucleotidyltransferase
MIVPDMGRKRKRAAAAGSGLADALFSRVQQRVLRLLFGQPDRRFQSAELIRLAGSGTGAVHRQLSRLAEAGWVTVVRTGNQKHYQANRACPAFAELHGLIVKTVGVVEPLRQALAPRAKDIRAAFVYGSVAKGTDKAASDVDLMVISDRLGYSDLFETLQSAEAVLARPVNPNVMSLAEWQAQRAKKDSFARRIAAQPRLFVIGSDDDLAA